MLFSFLICQCNTKSRCLNISWCHGFSGLDDNNHTVFTAIDINLYYVFCFYFKVSFTFQWDPWNCTFGVKGDTCVCVHLSLGTFTFFCCLMFGLDILKETFVLILFWIFTPIYSRLNVFCFILLIALPFVVFEYDSD